MAMVFPNIDRRKFFPRIFIRRPGYICLLLLFFSIASIIAEKVELILIERLQKQIYKDEIYTSDQELFLIVSSAEHRNNDIDIFVTIAEPYYYADPIKEVSRTPTDTERKTGTNEFLGGTELVESYIYNKAIDLYNSWSNKLVAFEFTGNMETELGGDLGLTPEEKFGLIALLKTLNDDSEQDQP